MKIFLILLILLSSIYAQNQFPKLNQLIKLQSRQSDITVVVGDTVPPIAGTLTQYLTPIGQDSMTLDYSGNTDLDSANISFLGGSSPEKVSKKKTDVILVQ